jgi:predicted transcriptional regulator/KaiC/GvpD/RAD55 family RecA-like ATPase
LEVTVNEIKVLTTISRRNSEILSVSEERRTKYDIYATIVEVIMKKGVCSLTRISYASNLPVDRAKKSLDLLVSHGFVKEVNVADHKKYQATKWGTEYLETYRRMQKFFAALKEPLKTQIPKPVLSDRVSTGHAGLDDLLLGGIPRTYAVILASPSCDEKEILVRKFVETAVINGEVTFYVTANPNEAKALADRYQSGIYLFVCNPQADTIIKDLPNVFALKGTENLNDINIALAGALRRLDEKSRELRRACIEIVSDVLLQHGAVQTRKWLSGLIPSLKSKGFTTLAVINPYMHASEEVQAVVGLFDGEICLYERESNEGPEKLLRVRKMHDQRYVESEMPFRT